MKLTRFAGRAFAAATLCLAGTLVPAGSAAYAADNDPVRGASSSREPIRIDQVLELDADPALTVGAIAELARRTLDSDPVVVDRVLAVRAEGSTLSADQIASVLAGHDTHGAELVGTVADPSPDTTAGGVAYRMRIPGQRILVIRGEVMIDGRNVPYLIIIILGY